MIFFYEILISFVDKRLNCIFDWMHDGKGWLQNNAIQCSFGRDFPFYMREEKDENVWTAQKLKDD